MRLRNIPGAREELDASPWVIGDERTWKGRFRQAFGMEGELHLEIGMGKGRFLMEKAVRFPEICFLGMEKYSSVLLRAVEKQEEMKFPNIRFLRMNAELLTDVFGEKEIDRIYLNFSDPWPKDRHAKRRLTSAEYLSRYQEVLKDGGLVEFKTDNRDLFAFSLEQAASAGWEILYETEDLHRDPEQIRENIMTEYEERFSGQGRPICKMVIRCPGCSGTV